MHEVQAAAVVTCAGCDIHTAVITTQWTFMPCWMRCLVQVWCTNCCLIYCRLYYKATREDETVILSGQMWHIRLEDPHGDPEQVAGPLPGPDQAVGLLPDMSPLAAATTAQVAKAGPGAVGAPLQAPALPAHTLVAPSVEALTSTAGSTAKVQHAPLLMHARHCATDRLLAYTIRPVKIHQTASSQIDTSPTLLERPHPQLYQELTPFWF